MQQIQQDLLICAIGSEEIATELAHRFRVMFPCISVHSEGMMGSLVSMSQHRFRVVIIATVSDIKAATGIMVRKIRECDYSANDIFVYHADNTLRGPVQYLVDEYGFDNEEGLFDAARKAAERDPYCRWRTQKDTDDAEARAELRRAKFEEWERNHPPPVRRPWCLKIIDSIRKRWPFQR